MRKLLSDRAGSHAETEPPVRTPGPAGSNGMRLHREGRGRMRALGCRVQGSGCRVTPLLLEHPRVPADGGGRRGWCPPHLPKRSCCCTERQSLSGLGARQITSLRRACEQIFSTSLRSLAKDGCCFFLSKGQHELHPSHESRSLPNFSPLVQGIKVRGILKEGVCQNIFFRRCKNFSLSLILGCN